MRNTSSFAASGSIALFLIVFAVLWYGTIDPTTVPGADLHAYRQMAAAAPGITNTVPAPFLYRLLPTWLAGTIGTLTGMPDRWAFSLVTLTSLGAALTLLLRRLLRAGTPTGTAIAVVVLFTLNPYLIGATVYNPYQACDALALLCILAALDALDRRHMVWFGIWLALGALTREPCLLVVLPAAWQVAGDRRGSASWIRLGIAALPAFALALVVRLALIPTIPAPGLLATAIDYLPKWVDPTTWMRILLTTFLPIGLVPWLHPRASVTWIRANTGLALFSVAVLASSFLGGDVERLLAPAIVLAYPMTASVLKRLRPVGWAVLLSIAVVGSLHYRYAVLSPFGRGAYAGVAIAMAVAGALATVVPRLTTRNLPAPDSPQRTTI